MPPPRVEVATCALGNFWLGARVRIPRLLGPQSIYQLADPDQPTFEQAEQEHGQASPDEQATDGYLEDNNYMPPSEDKVSLDDDEFSALEDPIKQKRFKRRLIATARSLKKK